MSRDRNKSLKSSALNIKTYVTPAGLKAIQDELHQLLREERPKLVETVSWAASNGDRSENGDYIYGKRRLREIDKRAFYLSKRLKNSQVVDPKEQKNLSQVFFGATVTYQHDDESLITVKIVGIDEADAQNNKISYTSPVAKALLKASVGDVVKVTTPEGQQEVEVLDIVYEQA